MSEEKKEKKEQEEQEEQEQKEQEEQEEQEEEREVETPLKEKKTINWIWGALAIWASVLVIWGLASIFSSDDEFVEKESSPPPPVVVATTSIPTPILLPPTPIVVNGVCSYLPDYTNPGDEDWCVKVAQEAKRLCSGEDAEFYGMLCCRNLQIKIDDDVVDCQIRVSSVFYR
ncbi:MAG: hypothetical protein L3J07_00505 [Candidatus Magasanikbacteria bacterium]|nr:hypothetical protein [Candidatus Magasanikbacteria bacterium]